MSAATYHEVFGQFLETLGKPVLVPAARVSVLSQAMPDQGEGVTGYQITGTSQADVQAEIDRVMDGTDARGGYAHFRAPAKSREAAYFGQWQSRGYTRLVEREPA